MTKAGFWNADWFLGVSVFILIVLFSRLGDLIRSLARKAYDLGGVAVLRATLHKIAVIAVDDRILAKLGRRSWPGDALAKMTDSPLALKAKVIAYAVLLSESPAGAGYTHVALPLEIAGAGAVAPAWASAFGKRGTWI